MDSEKILDTPTTKILSIITQVQKAYHSKGLGSMEEIPGGVRAYNLDIGMGIGLRAITYDDGDEPCLIVRDATPNSQKNHLCDALLLKWSLGILEEVILETTSITGQIEKTTLRHVHQEGLTRADYHAFDTLISNTNIRPQDYHFL